MWYTERRMPEIGPCTLHWRDVGLPISNCHAWSRVVNVVRNMWSLPMAWFYKVCSCRITGKDVKQWLMYSKPYEKAYLSELSLSPFRSVWNVPCKTSGLTFKLRIEKLFGQFLDGLTVNEEERMCLYPAKIHLYHVVHAMQKLLHRYPKLTCENRCCVTEMFGITTYPEIAGTALKRPKILWTNHK